MKIPIQTFYGPSYRRWCSAWWWELLCLPQTWYEDIKTFYHRGRYGWAPRDTWSLDHYLDGVLAGSLEHLADYTHSHPYGYGLTVEAWQEKLRGWAALSAERHAALFDSHDPLAIDALETKHRAMLADLGVWWGALWD